MRDWKTDQERERQVRLDRAAQIQRSDPRDGTTGTGFSNFERSKAEGNARIEQARRAQARDFLTRRDGSQPSEADLDFFLGKSDGVA